MVDEMQTMVESLTQSNGCAAAIAAIAGIAEKWWRQPTSDLDDGVTCTRLRAPGSNHGIDMIWLYLLIKTFFTSLFCSRHCLDMLGLLLRGENLDSGLVGWIQ